MPGVAFISYTLATFRSDFEYEIEYKYDFRISNQLSSQSRLSSLLPTCIERGSRNKIWVTDSYLKRENKSWKIVLVLRSEGPY